MFETMHHAAASGSPRRRWGARSGSPSIDVDGKKFALINPEIVEREQRDGRRPRRDVSRSPTSTATSSARSDVDGPRDRSRTGRSTRSRQRAARALPPARDRSSRRQAVHRLPERRSSARRRWRSGSKSKDEYPGCIRKRARSKTKGEHHHENEDGDCTCAFSSGARPNSPPRRCARCSAKASTSSAS